MLRRLAICLGAVALALALAGPAAARQHPIVYVVVLDGLDGDRIEAGRAPFISSLLAGSGGRGTYFPNSSSVIPAETNPNHVAMMSGAYPGRSGIPANAFALYAPLEGPDSCVATGPLDQAAPPSETSGESRTCPQAELVFEAIGRQGNPDRLSTAGVFGKPKLGRIFAGQNLDRGARTPTTSGRRAPTVPDDDAYCEPVPTAPVTGYALDDATVMDRVVATIDNGAPGPRGPERPDFTFVNLHQIDTAGHATGTGTGYDAAIGQADAQVERLVRTLRARGEWKRTVLILVSDHSMDTTSSKVSLTQALTAGGVPPSEFVALNDRGSIDFVYLADRTSPGRFELLAGCARSPSPSPGSPRSSIASPTRSTAARPTPRRGSIPSGSSLGPRSGDLFAVAQPGVGFGEPSPSANPLPRQPRRSADRGQLPRDQRRQQAGAYPDGDRGRPGVEPRQRRHRADGDGPVRAVRARGLAGAVPAPGVRPRAPAQARAPGPPARRGESQAPRDPPGGRPLRRRGKRRRRLEADRGEAAARLDLARRVPRGRRERCACGRGRPRASQVPGGARRWTESPERRAQAFDCESRNSPSEVKPTISASIQYWERAATRGSL